MRPEGWQLMKLGRICRLLSGGTPRMENATYWNGKIPWYTAKDLKTFHLCDAQMHLTPEGAISGTRLVPANTILLLVRGMTLFKDVPVGVTISESAFNQDIKALALEDEISSNYLAYYLAGHKSDLMAMVDTAGHGTGRLATDSLLSMDVLLPPPNEQSSIVDILLTWDRAIEQTQKQIDAKLRLKRGLMQQLLTGKLRFEEFRRSSWKEFRIGDLLEEVKRPITFDDNEQYDLISVRRRSGGLFHRGVLNGHQIETKDLRIAKAGDFLISRMQVVHGASGLTTPEFEGMKISGSYTALVSRDPDVLRIEFFDLLSRTPQLYRLAYLASWGVHIEKMTFSLPLYLKSKIRIPSDVAEQDKIVGVIRAASDEINKLEETLRLLKEQKLGLMHVLLTGKVRTKTPSAPVAVDHLPDVRNMVSVGANSRRKAKK